MPASESALNEAAWFLNGGRTYAKTGSNSSPKLIDWEQDFDLIVAAISRNIGCDIRGISLHWWTFLAYFGEIGESVFARVVGIRQKKLRGKKLDEQEREFARANRDLIVFQKIAKEPDSELLQFLGIN
jgi:hypothetical protein